MSTILIINSSARKDSNTRLLADRVAKGATKAGHTVKTIEVGNASIHPCVGCETCHGKTPGKCIFNDDMTAFYADIAEADTLIFSSPIYFFTVNAQTKLFIDRTYALGMEGLAGKQFGAVFAYGGEDAVDSGCINAIRMFQDICAFIPAKWVGAVYGTAWQEGDAGKNPELLNKAEEYGAGL